MLFLIILPGYCEATSLTPYLPVGWLPVKKLWNSLLDRKRVLKSSYDDHYETIASGLSLKKINK